MATDDAGRNTAIYPLCMPWAGERGPDFQRRFWPQFLNGLGQQFDKYCTLRAHIEGRDPGGISGTLHQVYSLICQMSQSPT